VARQRPPARWVAPFHYWVEEEACDLRRRKEPQWADALEALASDKSLDPCRRQLMGEHGPHVRPAAFLEGRKLPGGLSEKERRRVRALGILHREIARIPLIDFGDGVRTKLHRTHPNARLKNSDVLAKAGRMIGPFMRLYGKTLPGPVRMFTRALTGELISLDQVDTLIRHF
jgi:hypothetical protein